MSEEIAVAEAVPSTDVPVAIDPALLNKPVRPEEQAQTGSAGDSELLKHKLGLANQHAKQAKKEAEEARQEMQNLRKEMEQLKEAQQTAVRASLEEQGQYKQLWEDLKKTVQAKDARIIELEAQVESVTQQSQQERLKAAALSQINSAGALNSQQMYTLLQTALRQGDEGQPVVLNGGVEQPLGDYLANLKQSAEWQHHFGASAAAGMGSAPAASIAPGRDNPYKTGNLTEALRLEVENPELAKALKAEANRG
jgi:chromosome segregation ATPase